MDKKFKLNKLFLVKVAEATDISYVDEKRKVTFVKHGSYTLFAKVYQNENEPPKYKLMLGDKCTLQTRSNDIKEIGDLLIYDLQPASTKYDHDMTFGEIKQAEFKANGNRRFHRNITRNKDK